MVFPVTQKREKQIVKIVLFSGHPDMSMIYAAYPHAMAPQRKHRLFYKRQNFNQFVFIFTVTPPGGPPTRLKLVNTSDKHSLQ